MLLQSIVLEVPEYQIGKVLLLQKEMVDFEAQYEMDYKCTGSSSIQRWYQVKITSKLTGIGSSFWDIIESLMSIQNETLFP